MNRCPLTYEACAKDYSQKGLKQLSRNLGNLHELPFTCEDLRLEAAIRAEKMSIQGVQPKLSARLNVKKQGFDLVDRGGNYILKPQITDYKEVPENEDLTMRMAEAAGIDVPFHGLLYGSDRQLTYCIRRFDRVGRNKKVHVEDFAQLGGRTRDTKYRSSMEQVATLIDTYCTFPAVEKLKLFRLTLFSFLVGNEDMHLKNFSVISRGDLVTLSPAYDLLNTTIVLPAPGEELALPLNGKKNNLTRRDLIDYFGRTRLHLNRQVIDKVLNEFNRVQARWHELVTISFLSSEMQKKYAAVLENRIQRLFP